jgi:hypothetical protein
LGAAGNQLRDSQMDAFLSSRQHDFAVPRLGRAVASRQLTRGAGQVMSAGVTG